MNYIDKYGLYNEKPLRPGNMPSGNDGWILTAHAHKEGLPVDMEKLLTTFTLLKKNEHGMPLERLPNKPTPYLSRDVVLGLEYLGLYEFKDWDFCPFEKPKFNPFKTIASYVLAIGEHRNFLWKKDLNHAYRFMFKVPLHDRAFIQRCRGEKVSIIYKIIELIDKQIKTKDDSSRRIRWLKYET